MISKLDKNAKRKARHYRTRRHIIGTPARPRLNVYRSLNHIYAQVIDDSIGNTIDNIIDNTTVILFLRIFFCGVHP